MKIAIVGTGIAGLRAASRLHPHHEITVFEAADRIGGHTHTVPVDMDGEHHEVDTGFIVFNEENYPRFSRMLAELGVASRASDMSLAVSDVRSGIEYRGSALGLLARPGNVVNPMIARMVRDIGRFNRAGCQLLASADLDPRAHTETLADFIRSRRLSSDFVDLYLVPLGSAVWSADPTTFTEYPAVALCRFLDNHGLLRWRGRPTWRTVTGGSQRYVDALTAPFAHRIATSTPVHKIVRWSDHVELLTDEDATHFDAVVLATHSDQALRMLGDPSSAEHEVLSAIRYQPNDVVLHTDRSVMPTARRAWASWNVHRPVEATAKVAVTYHMNRLQGIESHHDFFVTLNRDDDIEQDAVIGRYRYDHPVYDTATLAAQARRPEISGVNRTWFAGAYWGYGFHEDGVRSGDWVADRLLRL